MRRGFTLVELVMVIAMLAIEAAMLGPPLTAAVKEYVLVSTRRQALAEARAAMDRMVKEIRLIPSSAAVVSVASPTNFQFEYPLGTPITYALNGTTLERNGVALASNVGQLQFRYYDSNSAETVVPANVRRVMIALTTTVPSGGGILPLFTTVFLRNTGNEYSNFTSP